MTRGERKLGTGAVRGVFNCFSFEEGKKGMRENQLQAG